MIATQILGPRLRIAVLGVPRGNIFALANYTTLSHNLFVRRKIYSIFDPIDQIVEELNEYQPHHLMSTSNFIATLAQEQLAGRLKISFDHPLSCLAGGAEPLTENVKRLAFDAWKVNVRNIYGTAECYLMATSCKEFNRLHVMNDLCIIEIVDKDNNPIPPGQNGYKVLLTNLYNYVQPIIRYEIEDVTGYVGQKCDCGLPFPILSSIKNRTTDILYFEKQDGSYEIFHPYRLVIPLRYESELWQYQIVQTARNELTFFYVPRNDSVEIEKQLMHTIKEALDQAGLESVVTLKVKRVESLSRDAKSGKFKMVESLGAPTHLDTALQK
jgi:phenylacetate-coenzyme A ligase PaaK-like adenylate-forming protein